MVAYLKKLKKFKSYVKNMISKYSLITLASKRIRLFGAIGIIGGIWLMINGVDISYILAFEAFIISSISFVFSAAATVIEANRRNIEKRLECFYKPIEQIIGSSVNIESKYNDIIFRLQEIRRYDHLAKDETTKELVRQLTGASKISATNIDNIKILLEAVKKDIIFYEEILAAYPISRMV